MTTLFRFEEEHPVDGGLMRNLKPAVAFVVLFALFVPAHGLEAASAPAKSSRSASEGKRDQQLGPRDPDRWAHFLPRAVRRFIATIQEELTVPKP
jgi:hypothetical protein